MILKKYIGKKVIVRDNTHRSFRKVMGEVLTIEKSSMSNSVNVIHSKGIMVLHEDNIIICDIVSKETHPEEYL